MWKTNTAKLTMNLWFKNSGVFQVYGIEQKDMWCTQCKWKKACGRWLWLKWWWWWWWCWSYDYGDDERPNFCWQFPIISPFYSGLLRRELWRETHWNVMYMWSSQYVIITIRDHHNMWSSQCVHITIWTLHMKLPRQCASATHTCDLLWYCRQDMIIVSWIKTIAIITQTHVIIQKMWSYLVIIQWCE